jgi:predicted ATPase
MTTHPAPANEGNSNGRPRRDGGKQPDPMQLELLALRELEKKLLVARDRIRLVARGETAGFYWYGPPGTGKTHLVLATLDAMGVKYHYHKGHITAQGLLELMKEHPDKVIVLDDVSAIFGDKKAVQYLLAALGRLQGQAA